MNLTMTAYLKIPNETIDEARQHFRQLEAYLLKSVEPVERNAKDIITP